MIQEFSRATALRFNVSDCCVLERELNNSRISCHSPRPSEQMNEAATLESFLAVARQLAQVHGESLTLAMVRRGSGLSRERIIKLCGPWCELRTLVGLSSHGPHARNSRSNSSIQERLRAAVAEHGENLTLACFCETTGFANALIARRFGSWGKLRQSIGLGARASIEDRYTDRQIFDDIQQVVSRIHRVPTFHGYKREGGRVSSQTMRNRFGTWQKVIYAYEDDLDRHSSGTPEPRFRKAPENPRAFYVFQCGEPLYYIEYDSMDFTGGKKTPLPRDFKL